MAGEAASRDWNVLFLAHRRELIEQASLTLGRFGIRHGLVMAGNKSKLVERRHWQELGHSMIDRAARVQVASVQTYVERMKDLTWKPRLILIDEAHHVAQGNLWGRIIEAYPDAFVVGYSATPERLDGRGLGVHADGYFEELVLGPSPSELIARGFLSQPEIYIPDVLNMKGCKKSGGDFERNAAAELVRSAKIVGSAVEYYGKLCPGEPAVAFCANIEEAESTAREFAAAGFRAAHVDGSLSDADRSDRLRGLSTGKWQVITSADLIGEGVDIPVIRAAILLRPTDSLVLNIQQCGRAGRPVYAPGYDLETEEGRLAAIAASNKPTSIILDHCGNTFRHGLITEDREWSLDGRRRGTRAANDNTPSVNVRQCPKCFFAHVPAPACPHCNYVYEVMREAPEQIDGTLKKVDAEFEAALRRQMKAEERQCETLDDWKELARKRGHKEGWAYIQFNLRQKKRA